MSGIPMPEHPWATIPWPMADRFKAPAGQRIKTELALGCIVRATRDVIY